MVNSAIGAYYYLRIIVVMYMREARKDVPVNPISFGLGVALAISVVSHALSRAPAESGTAITRRFCSRFAHPGVQFRPLRKTRPQWAFRPSNFAVENRKTAFDKDVQPRASCVQQSSHSVLPLKELTSGVEERKCPN